MEDNVDTLRLKILISLLKACTPVSGKIGQYLVKRRIFKPTWEKQKLRMFDAKPKELSMSGPIPIPYNCRILDGEPGQIYLCEGVIDTLTLVEQGFPAVGVPGAANFKSSWAEMFRNKSIHVAFDPDAPGENGAIKTMEILQAHRIEARRFVPPKGMDLNDWFQKG